jgi:hypothetical protein
MFRPFTSTPAPAARPSDPALIEGGRQTLAEGTAVLAEVARQPAPAGGTFPEAQALEDARWRYTQAAEYAQRQISDSTLTASVAAELTALLRQLRAALTRYAPAATRQQAAHDARQAALTSLADATLAAVPAALVKALEAARSAAAAAQVDSENAAGMLAAHELAAPTNRAVVASWAKERAELGDVATGCALLAQQAQARLFAAEQAWAQARDQAWAARLAAARAAIATADAAGQGQIAAALQALEDTRAAAAAAVAAARDVLADLQAAQGLR